MPCFSLSHGFFVVILIVSQLKDEHPKQGMKPQNKTHGINLVGAQVRATLHKLLLREKH